MSVMDWHQRGARERRFIEWLRRDRWFADEYSATQSRSIYSLVDERQPPDRYGTSILGVVNGYLPIIRLVLVVCWDDNGRYWLALKRRWW